MMTELIFLGELSLQMFVCLRQERYRMRPKIHFDFMFLKAQFKRLYSYDIFLLKQLKEKFYYMSSAPPADQKK